MSETISRPFTFVKDGVFYFTRRIPNELKRHYTSPRIANSLRTKKDANAFRDSLIARGLAGTSMTRVFGTVRAVTNFAGLKDYVPDGGTMHGFRHSMRDRLRAVECPADIVDQIGGWQTDGVGHGCGSGYPLDVLRKWMKAVTRADMVYGSLRLQKAELIPMG